MLNSSYMQWYNDNELRAYPLREASTRIATSGRTIPDDILVDIGIMVPPGLDDVYVSSLRITPALISIGLSTSTSGLLLGTFARSSTDPHRAYPLTPIVDDVSGWVAFGNYIASGIDDYRFTGYAQSGLEHRTVRVVDALPVKRFVRYDGRMDKYADQVVKLRAGPGIVIERDDVDPQKVIVKLRPDMKHRFVGPCNDPATRDNCGVPPIRRLAGVCPDEDGRITIRFE